MRRTEALTTMPRRSQDATQIYRILQTAREATSLRNATYDSSRGAFSLNLCGSGMPLLWA